jgi:hypothetical protein
MSNHANCKDHCMSNHAKCTMLFPMVLSMFRSSEPEGLRSFLGSLHAMCAKAASFAPILLWNGLVKLRGNFQEGILELHNLFRRLVLSNQCILKCASQKFMVQQDVKNLERLCMQHSIQQPRQQSVQRPSQQSVRSPCSSSHTAALLNIVPLAAEFGGRNTWKLESELGHFTHK